MTNSKGRFGIYGGQYIPETLMNGNVTLHPVGVTRDVTTT